MKITNAAELTKRIEKLDKNLIIENEQFNKEINTLKFDNKYMRHDIGKAIDEA